MGNSIRARERLFYPAPVFVSCAVDSTAANLLRTKRSRPAPERLFCPASAGVVRWHRNDGMALIVALSATLGNDSFTHPAPQHASNRPRKRLFLANVAGTTQCPPADFSLMNQRSVTSADTCHFYRSQLGEETPNRPMSEFPRRRIQGFSMVTGT